VIANGSLEFGKLISTSNRIRIDDCQAVTVETDSPLLWSMELGDGRQKF